MRPVKANEIRVGDCVQLKTGGYLMTVWHVYPYDATIPIERVECVWFDIQGQIHRDTFGPEGLRRWLLDDSVH